MNILYNSKTGYYEVIEEFMELEHKIVYAKFKKYQDALVYKLKNELAGVCKHVVDV